MAANTNRVLYRTALPWLMECHLMPQTFKKLWPLLLPAMEKAISKEELLITPVFLCNAMVQICRQVS